MTRVLTVVEVFESPKVHDHAVGLLVEESVKLTARGAAPIVGVPEKFATGAATDTVM